jgi:hypothetical protein
MVPRLWLLPLSGVCLFAVAWADALGQTAQAIRFNPAVGSRVHTIWRTEILVSVVNADGSPVDTLLVEATRLESVTRFVDAADDGRYSVELQYDSVRARKRLRGGTWHDVEPSELEVTSVRVLLDDRARLLGAEFVYLPHVTASQGEVMRGFAGGTYMHLPEGQVAADSSWNSALRIPLTALASLGRPEDVPGAGELVARVTTRVDSMAIRETDTLAYMSLQGIIASTVGRDGDPHTGITAGGSVAATLVWSSAWDAYVTGAVRCLVAFTRPRDRESELAAPELRFDMTTQFQVRP